MQDLIIKASGNSRYLKTAPDALSKYPSYPDFIQALVNGEFPVDLLGINLEGVVQMGTPYQKRTVLPDPTAEKYGLDRRAATVAQVFDKLAEGGFAFRQVEKAAGKYPRVVKFPFAPSFIIAVGWASGGKRAVSFSSSGEGGTVTIAGKSGLSTNWKTVLSGDTLSFKGDPGGEIAGAHNVSGKYDIFVAFR